MAINDRTRIALPLIVRFTLVAALAGAVYSFLTATGGGAAGLEALKRGVLSGGLIGVILSSLNIFVLEAPIGAPLRRMPFIIASLPEISGLSRGFSRGRRGEPMVDVR